MRKLFIVIILIAIIGIALYLIEMRKRSSSPANLLENKDADPSMPLLIENAALEKAANMKEERDGPTSSIPYEDNAPQSRVKRDSPLPTSTEKDLIGVSADISSPNRITVSPDRPPGLNAPDQPLNLELQIHQFIQQIMASHEPEIEEQAMTLFTSEDPVLRMTGAALLAEIGLLESTGIKKIANEEDPTHALSVLGWLLDTGQTEEAEALRNLFLQQDVTEDQLAQLFAEGRLEGISGRAALDILNGKLSAEDKHDLFIMIANDGAQTYDVRMKALIDLRATTELPHYREVIQNVRMATMGQDALWDEGIKRLYHRLQGPLELMQGPLMVNTHDIDFLVAREYPRMLEDLALQLEYAVAQQDSLIALGTSERLQERLDRLNQMPWTAEQVVSLKRLENLVVLLKEREQAFPSISTSSQGPPGD